MLVSSELTPKVKTAINFVVYYNHALKLTYIYKLIFMCSYLHQSYNYIQL